MVKAMLDRFRFLGFGSTASSKYWLTRFVFLRFLGGMYFVGFLILVNQGLPLIGENGLLPAKNFIDTLGPRYETTFDAFLKIPTLFWFHLSDRILVTCAWIGAILSFLVLIGFANVPILLILWFLYMSFVNIGQTWYGFGWESQLLETGFLGIFICPLVDPRPFPRSPPPAPVFWLLRWLIFRIHIGAGMIKIRNDDCWWNLTCMVYHYETQPLPNPLSPWFHFMPSWFHKFEVLWNHITELIAPLFVFGPRPFRHLAGLMLVFFQILLILSGNLSFINWLTLTASVACFDDSFLRHVLPRSITQKAEQAEKYSKSELWPSRMSYALMILVFLLSIPVVQNMMSPRQIMNTSFDRLRLVNTYGLFGTIGKKRHELIIEGTTDESVDTHTSWRSYEFKAKPGATDRPLPLISPYHYRLDWQIWFAAMSVPQQHPWVFHLIWKLLHNDAGVLSLLANNPFPEGPPENIRIEMYRYKFLPPGDESGKVWNNEHVGTWLNPVSKSTPGFKRLIQKNLWKP